MSYSWIIRESEDLGAGIFDPQGRELCESDSNFESSTLAWPLISSSLATSDPSLTPFPSFSIRLRTASM